MRRLTIVLLLAAWAPAPEHAAPVFLPTRDVQVEYRLTASVPHPPSLTVSYSARLRRARIDAAGEPAYAIVDRDRGRIVYVIDLLRSTVEQRFDVERGWQFLLGQRARFSPLGRERVAGLACRDWTVHTDQGDATACLTADGVLLRGTFTGSRRGTGSIEAAGVSFAPQPGALLQAPADYRALPDLALLRGLLGHDFAPAASLPPPPPEQGQRSPR